MTLIRVLCFCALFAALPVQAAELLTFGGFSRHFERDIDHNETNPGIGYERDYDDDWSWNVGVFKNSLRRAAFYATANYALWKPVDGVRVGITAGLSSGYHQSPIIPLLMPFAEWRIQRFGVQAYLVPTVKPYIDGAVVFQFKWRID